MGRKRMDVDMSRYLLYMPKELLDRARLASREGAGVSLNRWVMGMIRDGVEGFERDKAKIEGDSKKGW